MYASKLREDPFAYKPMITTLGDGINTFLPPLEIADSEWSYGRNCSSRYYPALSTRPGRKYVFSQITIPNILGQRNNQYPHVLDGTTWKAWSGSTWTTVKSSLTSATGKFIDFRTGTTLYTIMANGTDKYSWDGSTATNLTNMPATKYVAVHKGRVYAVSGKTLYFSALNLINDWTTVDDAGQIYLTNAKGDCTAITSYGNHIITFTEFSMHELYGTSPETYTLTDVEGAKGCISDKSIVELNGALYWLHYDGIYIYTGGVPAKISDKVNSYIAGINLFYKANCVSWGKGYSIYFSIPYGASQTTNNLTIEYDTKFQKWYIHSYGVVDSTVIGNTSYGLLSDGHISDMEYGTDDYGSAISWEVIGKVSNELYMRGKRMPIGHLSSNKTLSEIWLQIDLPVDSTLHVYLSNTESDNDFVEVFPTEGSITGSAEVQTLRFVLPVSLLTQNLDVYRLRFSGTGPCKIYTVEKDIRIKLR